MDGAHLDSFITPEWNRFYNLIKRLLSDGLHHFILCTSYLMVSTSLCATLLPHQMGKHNNHPNQVSLQTRVVQQQRPSRVLKMLVNRCEQVMCDPQSHFQNTVVGTLRSGVPRMSQLLACVFFYWRGDGTPSQISQELTPSWARDFSCSFGRLNFILAVAFGIKTIAKTFTWKRAAHFFCESILVLLFPAARFGFVRRKHVVTFPDIAGKDCPNSTGYTLETAALPLQFLGPANDQNAPKIKLRRIFLKDSLHT